MSETFEVALRSVVGVASVTRQAPLAPLTTLRVGGPADWLVEARSSEATLAVLQVARRCGLPVTLIGGGSNVLVADAGIRGVVVRVRGGDASLVGPGRVRADAGVTINGLVRWTVSHGLSGLADWAGTPGTVGGAVHGNAHFDGRPISDVVLAVRLVDRVGRVLDVPARDLAFGYDYSRLQDTGEVVLSADFRVGSGDPPALRAVARASLAFRKRTQPLAAPSAGCIFQNPDRTRDRVPEGVPCSAGALIDKAGLKGVAVGGARVSPVHANFIVNDGSATAADIWALMARCRRAVKERFGIELRNEVVCLGSFE
jgi:UDP-N-acetylmuramate dehydrogenase